MITMVFLKDFKVTDKKTNKLSEEIGEIELQNKIISPSEYSISGYKILEVPDDVTLLKSLAKFQFIESKEFDFFIDKINDCYFNLQDILNNLDKSEEDKIENILYIMSNIQEVIMYFIYCKNGLVIFQND